MNKQIQTYKRSTIDPRAFVILDDCLYDNTWSRDKMMRLLFMNGRHWKIYVSYYNAISIRYTTNP